MGRKERLKLILNQQDPALSSRVVVYYDYLNKDRLERIQEINAILKNLAELERDKKSKATRLGQILAEKKIEQEKLAGTKKTREILLARLNKETSSRKKQLHRLQEGEKRLKSLLVSLVEATSDIPFQAGPTKPFHQLRGQLAWPVRGTLVKKYGSKRANRQWDGVLIGAREGTEVRAVTQGRIVYSDWLKGYGLLIIIDHGKDYMTIYAFNRGLLKGVGEWVDAGDIIAEVGNSNGRNQSGLYFGKRKKGNPVDPEKWCRKIRKGRVS
jgi:septal ring factor EnvC (AmiA/AmiB activator)